ncbi:hypothetical protein EPD60_11105 [Flaviaesturariibacter flavus]|uniref:Lipocalin-like domain-containing protein n=1 Tax=Flaviaesturariibacter flavus TaxID=2502780 RepID=A0A4R1BBX3_9BACT|nr:hypothetical protein [Flaviaesturariibacter flavus]TCJ14525.1 hypothetical protein EPD60_11105 [Flaviaesturariibacter flavus]
MRLLKITVAFLILVFYSCSKNQHAGSTLEKTAALSVDFDSLSVKTVQEQIKGRWRLRRITGGFGGPQVTHPVTHNPYIILSEDHLVMGNDSLGVFVDAPITWAPATQFGSGYVLSTPNDAVQLVPSGIRNDTLYLLQYAADGVTYHYTR